MGGLKGGGGGGRRWGGGGGGGRERGRGLSEGAMRRARGTSLAATPPRGGDGGRGNTAASPSPHTTPSFTHQRPVHHNRGRGRGRGGGGQRRGRVAMRAEGLGLRTRRSADSRRREDRTRPKGWGRRGDGRHGDVVVDPTHPTPPHHHTTSGDTKEGGAKGTKAASPSKATAAFDDYSQYSLDTSHDHSLRCTALLRGCRYTGGTEPTPLRTRRYGWVEEEYSAVLVWSWWWRDRVKGAAAVDAALCDGAGGGVEWRGGGQESGGWGLPPLPLFARWPFPLCLLALQVGQWPLSSSSPPPSLSPPLPPPPPRPHRCFCSSASDDARLHPSVGTPTVARVSAASLQSSE